MKLFITGASGFLGRAVLERLIKDDRVDKVICLIHNNSVAISNDKIEEIHGDIGRLQDIVIDEKIDRLILIAGVTNGRGASNRETLDINYGGVESGVSFCKKNGIAKITYVSSINVKLKRRGVYADSKRKAENLLKNCGLDYQIFRPALIYGYNQKLGLGVIESCIRKFHIVPVFGDGKKIEQPIHVDECADLMTYYILNENRNIIRSLAGRTPMTYNSLCKNIAKIIGEKAILLHIPIAPIVLGLNLCERLHIPFPISLEQIYHIDSDLSVNMSKVYAETGLIPREFEELYFSR